MAIGFEEPRQQLENVLMVLNGEHRWVAGEDGNRPLITEEDRASLIRYVEAWNEAKRNPWKMKLSPDDERRFSLRNLEKVWRLHLALIGRTSETEKMVRDLERTGKRIRDDDAGGAYWFLSPTGENCDLTAMFVSMLITTPLRDRLSDRPCQREKCRKWFIKQRRTQKGYCKKYCGDIVRQTARTKEKRRSERQSKLRKANIAIRVYGNRPNWKERTSLKTGISTKFITRAVNKNELAIAPREKRE